PTLEKSTLLNATDEDGVHEARSGFQLFCLNRASRHQHFDILRANAHLKIVQCNNLCIKPTGILYMSDDIFAPIPGDQRAFCAHRIVMILGRVVINDPSVRNGCPPFRRLVFVNKWSRKDMGSPRPKRAGDFHESRRSIKNMFKNILTDNEIESFVGKCLIFKVLATVTSVWMSISKTQLRIILRRCVGSALLG